MADSPVLSDEEVERRLRRLDELLGELEQLPGPGTARALDAVSVLSQVYGAALQRVMDRICDQPALLTRLTADPLVDHLLVLHGISPRPLNERIGRALDALGPMLSGGEVRLADLDGGVATLHLVTGGHGCGSATAGMDATVRDAVLAEAPELERVDVVTTAAPAPPALIPVDSLVEGLHARQAAPA